MLKPYHATADNLTKTLCGLRLHSTGAMFCDQETFLNEWKAARCQTCRRILQSRGSAAILKRVMKKLRKKNPLAFVKEG